MPTAPMGESGIVTQFSQPGWPITQNTAIFTTLRRVFATGMSTLRRRWVTCLEWKIAAYYGIIHFTTSYGKRTWYKVRWTSNARTLTLVGTYSGFLRALLATF